MAKPRVSVVVHRTEQTGPYDYERQAVSAFPGHALADELRALLRR